MTAPGQRWYVVRTQSQSEGKALFNLVRQGFAAYLPRYRKRRRHARRTEIVAAPLFPRYLFVALDLAVQRWRAIHSTVGVVHLICAGEQPAPVPDGIVEDIRAREDAGGMIELPVPSAFKKGAVVRIVDGAFAGQSGLFETLTDERRVAVLLDLLGRQVRLVLPGESIAAA
ncbi:MAG: transcriptional activator RfaH [Rhodospirillales bacterium]|nr:transcriptional activator RfaH [Rhodospirillales bacterium]